jgi:two-component system, OmpR family, sensor kinase
MIGRLRRRRANAGLRNRLLAVVLLATIVALIATTAGFNLLLAARLDATADDSLRTQVQTERAEVDTAHGRMTVPDFPRAGAVIDEPVWIFMGKRAIERPGHLVGLDREAFSLAGGPERTLDIERRSVRMLAVPVMAGDRQVGTIVAAVSMTPYHRARDTALVISLGVAVTVLLLVLVSTRWVLAAGLRPVAQMTAQAAEWSENDLDRRFGLGPPHDELTQLAATLDALLGRLAAGLRHERHFSAELSHELRTPLTRMRAQAQLALADDLTGEQREAWDAVLRSSGEMAGTLDALLAGARADARDRPGVADARHAAEAVAARFAPLAAERGVQIAVDAGGDRLRAGVDAELLERLLQPLVDNACRYATSEVALTVGRDAAHVVFEIADDGPGVRADERERIFEPAVRGSAGTALREGTGLGLALARRLARAAGGSVEALDRGDGACFVVRVPRA